MNKNLPIIQVLKITDNPDGSATIDFEFGEDFVAIVKSDLKLKKRPTEKQISKFLLEAIEETVNQLEKED